MGRSCDDIVWRAVSDAWTAWEHDPRVALEILATRLSGATAHRGHGAVWLARMALRVGDARALAPGVAMARDGWSGIEEGRVGLMRRWMTGIAEPDATTAAAIVSSVVAALEALGYLGLAGDAAADGALLTARAGRPTDGLVGRAQRLYAATDVVPVLGPLPEIAWYAPHRAASAVPTRDDP